MSVYLGSSGRILLARNDGKQPFFTDLEPSDVNEFANRFAIDYAHEQVITGDRITISTIRQEDEAERPDLDWIEGADTEITRYVHVDAAGGLRLYDTFEESINDDKKTSINLTQPTETQRLSVYIDNSEEQRCLAQVTDYSITTTRENLDITALSDHYRKEYENGLIQGQGTISCFWEFRPDNCDPERSVESEFAAYLAKLCIRLQQGASFQGFFYLYYNDADGSNRDVSVWYQCDRCLITDVVVTVDVDQPIRTDIRFVTSGPIKLQEGYLPGYILVEDNTRSTGGDFGIGLEQPGDGALELNNPDE